MKLDTEEFEQAALLRERRELARRRYFAKTYDLLLVCILLGGSFAASGLVFWQSHDSMWLIIVGALCQIIYEAGLIANFGTTPGKHFLGLSVVHPTGGNLTLRESLERSWLTCLRGQAFRIFVLGDWCLWRNYKRFCETGTTSWDHIGVVKAERLTGFARFGYGLGTLLFFSGYALSGVFLAFIVVSLGLGLIWAMTGFH